MEDEDFWNTSEVKAKALNFDEDEQSSDQFSKLGAQLRAGLSSNAEQESKTLSSSVKLLPLTALLSDKTLAMILAAQTNHRTSLLSQSSNDVDNSVSITLQRIINGRPYSINHFKSLKSKTELLDGAISIGDGNAILTVMLFIVQTLKKKLVHQILSTRPVAVNHYLSYLTTRMKVHETTDLLVMLGRSSDAAMKQYQMSMTTMGSSIDVLMNKLKNLSSNHFSQPAIEPIYPKLIGQYIKLLEWQKSIDKPDLHNKSVIQSLAYCCTNHWSDGAGKIASPQTFSQQQQISPKQYDWTALTVHALLKNWEVLETMFVKKNFLGKTTLSCSLPLPKIIGHLRELGSNTILLSIYLNHISSVSQRLELALQHKVSRTVIDCYVLQKDRLALTEYKMTLHPQSEEYFYAENALRSNTVKWKN